jgi:hypothetical protein
VCYSAAAHFNEQGQKIREPGKMTAIAMEHTPEETINHKLFVNLKRKICLE